jgi:hypothetical protein
MADGYGRGALLTPTPEDARVTRQPDPDPDAPSASPDIVTLVLDGGTAYVLIEILGMTIDSFRSLVHAPQPVEVLVHAHDELAGQLGMPPYADREPPHGA